MTGKAAALTDEDKMAKDAGGKDGVCQLWQWAVFDGGNGQRGRWRQ
jgi:hypothetical protein